MTKFVTALFAFVLLTLCCERTEAQYVVQYYYPVYYYPTPVYYYYPTPVYYYYPTPYYYWRR